MSDLVQNHFKAEYDIFIDCCLKDRQLVQELRVENATFKKVEINGKLASNAKKCADALLNAQGACMIKQDWSFGRKSLTMHQVETLLREWNNKEKYYCEERDAAEQQAQTEQFTLARQFMGGQDATSNHNISRPQIMDTSSVVNPSPQEQQANPQPPQWLGGPPQHQPLGLQPSQDRQQMSLSSTSNPNLQQQPYNQPAYGGQLALQSNSAQNQLTPWQPQWSQQQQREDQQIFGYPPNSITILLGYPQGGSPGPGAFF